MLILGWLDTTIVQKEFMNAVKPEELAAILKKAFDKGYLERVDSDYLA